MGRYRVQLYWGGRTDSLPRMGEQLWTWVGQARAAAPPLRELAWVDRKHEGMHPLRNAIDCTRALEDGIVRWKTGDVDQVSYRARLVLAREFEPPFEALITCGIAPLPIDDVFAPNRFDVYIRDNAGEALVSPGVMALLLRAGVTAFLPDWGYVGTDLVPQAPMAIFSDARPRVGWMTYLAPSFRANTVPVREPAVVSVLDGNGVVFTARPELFDPGNPEHVASIAAVEAALRAGGVLPAQS